MKDKVVQKIIDDFIKLHKQMRDRPVSAEAKRGEAATLRKELKERLDQARAQKAAASSPLSFGRIAKPLRGGGGSASTNASSTSPSVGASAASPLSRVQNDER